MDPPRKGLDDKTIQNILKLKIKKFVYVSCNPGTLARDVEMLEGYEVKKVQPVDMFPWSYHTEVVLCLELAK